MVDSIGQDQMKQM